MKRLMAILLCLCMLLCGCSANEGPYTPTGDGLTYDDDYTGPQNTPTTPDGNQVFSLAYYKERSLNPYQCADYTNRVLFSLLYQGLFSVSRNYVVEPALCKSYTVSRDMKTYTFYLENATFSDGTAVNVRDVEASLHAAKESDYYKGRFLHITAVEVTADSGVKLTLDTPMENLPLLLDIPIVPAEQVALEKPIGTGPYALYSAAGGDSLRKRADWWSKAKLPVNAATISLFPAESTTQIRDQFEFFDLSLACTDPGSDRYADYRCDFELWDSENGIFLYLATSADSKVFSNDAVRIALTHAVDRDTLVAEYYRSFARSASLPASPYSPLYSQTLAERYKYDAEKFKKAVTDSGMEGHSVVFLVNSEDSLRLRVARRIGEMLKAGGLKVTMRELGGSRYVEAVKTRQFDLYLGQTRLSPNMDLSAFFATYGELSWGGVNDLGAYALSLQALENHGNYFTLHKQVMDQGLLCPVLVRSYAIYSARGVVSSLAPARDNLFYYATGKSLEDVKINLES